jgi:hypothetical protein
MVSDEKVACKPHTRTSTAKPRLEAARVTVAALLDPQVRHAALRLLAVTLSPEQVAVPFVHADHVVVVDALPAGEARERRVTRLGSSLAKAAVPVVGACERLRPRESVPGGPTPSCSTRRSRTATSFCRLVGRTAPSSSPARIWPAPPCRAPRPASRLGEQGNSILVNQPYEEAHRRRHRPHSTAAGRHNSAGDTRSPPTGARRHIVQAGRTVFALVDDFVKGV